ncbi:hypothetical protein VNO77_37318 [Canavalia gladiata]|uniref:Uncharacterized protein n=1 Tax=Canavalia gladiata TaxID=3824 RepID=A0AAN9KAP9_CANGL
MIICTTLWFSALNAEILVWCWILTWTNLGMSSIELQGKTPIYSSSNREDLPMIPRVRQGYLSGLEIGFGFLAKVYSLVSHSAITTGFHQNNHVFQIGL